MAEILEMSQLVDQYGMAKMEVWRGRIEACLYAQWPPAANFSSISDSSSNSSEPRLIRLSASAISVIPTFLHLDFDGSACFDRLDEVLHNGNAMPTAKHRILADIPDLLAPVAPQKAALGRANRDRPVARVVTALATVPGQRLNEVSVQGSSKIPLPRSLRQCRIATRSFALCAFARATASPSILDGLGASDKEGSLFSSLPRKRQIRDPGNAGPANPLPPRLPLQAVLSLDLLTNAGQIATA